MSPTGAELHFSVGPRQRQCRSTLQDMVILMVIVCGLRQGCLIHETYANEIYPQVINGKPMSAIQATTAAAICTVLDLLVSGRLPQQGLIRQEQISYPEFLASRLGALDASGSRHLPRMQHLRRRNGSRPRWCDMFVTSDDKVSMEGCLLSRSRHARPGPNR